MKMKISETEHKKSHSSRQINTYLNNHVTFVVVRYIREKNSLTKYWPKNESFEVV